MSSKKISKKTNTNNYTRKNSRIEKLNKSPRSRIVGMETYKVNCGKNLLIGYKSIKSSEETSNHKDDFVHVLLSSLSGYNKPVIVKVYDENNFHLKIELRILEKMQNYRNTANLICHFSYNDDKNRYFNKIRNKIKFCMNGEDKLHFFIYEYIKLGDIIDFFASSSRSNNEIRSLILQTSCIIIQLASIYKIYHGDINSGNILIDICDKEIISYNIEDEIFEIESFGIMPKIIDFGRSNLYREHISLNDVWFDIILVLGIIHNYVSDPTLKHKILNITNDLDLLMPDLKSYFIYLQSKL